MIGERAMAIAEKQWADEAQGWIEWGGGECPVEAGTLIDIRDRDGTLWTNVEALDETNLREMWLQIDRLAGNDIVAYRTVPADAPSASALNSQVAGTHYKQCAIQPVQYIEANNLKFLEGCIVKRATRHDKETGKGREDIKKIIHEAKLILEIRYGG